MTSTTTLPLTKLLIRDRLTEAYLSELPGLIRDVAEELSIPEPKAVTLVGKMLERTNRALFAFEIIATVKAIRAKEPRLLTSFEKSLMFAIGWLERTVPFRASHTTGRNEPCFCGSGKKYKLCCLELVKAHDTLRYTNGE